MASLKNPPQLIGLPFIRNTYHYIRDPVALIRKGYETLGLIFSVRVGLKTIFVLLGPEYNRFFFDETDKLLSHARNYRWVVSMFGNRFPLTVSMEEYRHNLELYSLPFHKNNFDGYLLAMIDETLTWLDDLGKEGKFELVNSMNRLIMNINARIFLGNEVRLLLADRLLQLFKDISGRTSIPVLRKLPSYRRVKAKSVLLNVLKRVVAERIKNDCEENDFLGVMLKERSNDNRQMSDEFIIDFLVGMVWTGHKNPTHHISWALMQLLKHPDYLNFVIDEQVSILGKSLSPDVNSLNKLQHLEWALKETERMYPAVSLIGRYSRESIRINGYLIPKDCLILVSPAVSHRLPEVFSNPDVYDPYRFSPGREEDRKTPFSLIGFGSGLHSCMGKNFSYIEMKIILSLLIQRYSLELLSPIPSPKSWHSPPLPDSEIFIRYR